MAVAAPAVVTQVTGRAFIRNPDGSLTELHVGSHVPPNSEIVTASGSTVSLQVDGGMPVLIGEGRDVAFTGEVTGGPVDPQEAAVAPPSGTDSDRLLAALQNGQDPFDSLDPTAALVAGGGDAGGSSFVRLARILETTTPLALEYPNPGVAAINLAGASSVAANNDGTANDGPTAGNDAATTTERSAVTGNVLTNDSDANGDVLTIVSVGDRPMSSSGVTVAGSTGGSFTVFPDGSYIFNPGDSYHNLGAGQAATSNATYTVTDPSGSTSTATITVTINGLNDAPTSTVIGNHVNVDADKNVNVDVSGHFADVDKGDKLTYTATGLPAGLVIDANTGLITGTIDHSASQHGANGAPIGVYSITVTATDLGGAQTSQTFNWTVTNPGPVAFDDSGAAGQNASALGNVILGDAQGRGADLDPDADKLSVAQVNGQASNVGQAVAGDHGGSFTINADGTYTFNAGHAFDSLGAGQTAITSITYLVTDNEGGTSPATLTITVTGSNDGPTSTALVNQTSLDAQTNISLDLSGHFSDVDAGDKLTFSAAGLPDGLTIDTTTGVITGTIDHSASQHGVGGGNGAYTITVTATDQSGATTTQSFDWTITNPGPVAANDAGAAQQGGITAGNVIAGDSQGRGVDVDPDGDKLSIAQVNGQEANIGRSVAGDHGGSFTVNADGTYTFNAGHDFDSLSLGQTATTSITYLVTDNEGGTSPATLTITVTGSNDAPTSTALVSQTGVDAQSTISVDVSSHFTDVDSGDKLNYTVSGLPAGLTIDPNTGVISGTIDHSASQHGAGTATNGVYTITVTATDLSGATTSQSFNWTVTNPGPTANDDTNASTQNGSATGNVLTLGAGKDIDPDGDTLSVAQVNGHAGSVGQAVAGDHGGSFTINSDGSYAFNAGHAFDYLGAGQTATTSIAYLASDGEGGTSPAKLTITVTGSNDAPTSTALVSQTGLDAQANLSLDVSGHFSDVDTGDKLTFSVAGLPAGLTIDPTTGVITGTIDHSASQGGDHGVYHVTVTATDLAGSTTSQTFDWTVGNPPPLASADMGAAQQGANVNGNVLTNDTDPDGDKLVVAQVNGQTGNVGQAIAGDHGGTFTVNPDGSYVFNAGHAFDSLGAGQTATTSITYLASDGEGGTSQATLTVTVTGTNDAPTSTALVSQSGVDAQSSISLDVSSHFTDVDSGDKLTYSVSGLPAGLAINQDTGVISGTIDHSASQHGANGAVNGVYTITVTATDLSGATTSQSFNWTVTNPGPAANDDTNASTQNGSATGNVLTLGAGKDIDPDGDTLSVAQVNGHAGSVGQAVAGDHGGSFTINSDGSYAFNAGHAFDYLGAGQTATTSIAYLASDGEGGTSPAKLSITVTGSNDAPTSTALVSQTGLDAQANLSLDVSGHFSDVDTGDKLTYSVSGLPAGLTINQDTGVISGTIDHSASQHGAGTATNGVYTITVTATDVSGATTSQSFNWTVTNPGPTAHDDTGSSTQSGSATGNVLILGAGKDIDPDGDTLSVAQVNGHAGSVGQAVAGDHGGSFTINSDGSYTFNAGHAFDHLGAGQTATTSIAYLASDGEGGTSPATLTITVTGSNDTPTSTALVSQTGLDAQANLSLDVSGHFSDVDTGDKLTFSVAGLPAGLTIDPTTGVITGTIDHSASQSGDHGVYRVTVTATDLAGSTTSQTFDWTVGNPPPLASADTGAAQQGANINGNVLTNDMDPDGDKLVVAQVNGQTGNVGQAIAGDHGGTFTVNPDGSYVFNAGHAFDSLGVGQTATTSITYLSSDGEGGTSEATLTVTVTGTNDAPTSTALISQNGVDAQSNISLDVSSHFTDVDTGDKLTYSVSGLPAGLAINQDTGVISGTIDHSASQHGAGTATNGVYTITVTATDKSGAATSQSFNWTVTNPGPTANDDTNASTQNGSATGNVLTLGAGKDIDPDGDTLSVAQVNGHAGSVGKPSQGTMAAASQSIVTVLTRSTPAMPSTTSERVKRRLRRSRIWRPMGKAVRRPPR